MALRTLLILVIVAAAAQAFTKNSACKCGQKSVARIVGGTQSSVGAWPWQAGLVVGTNLFCGGSLINDRYVLTAAHCVNADQPGDFVVWLSDHTLSSSTETTKVVRSVSSIIVHANYTPGDEFNDIALLKLSSPVTVSSNLLPVCLPPPTPTYANQQATVTGWGVTSSGSSSVSDVLREVTIPVLSNTACQAPAVYGSAITENMLCAGSTGKDSCQGDSGGPLVFKDAGSNYDQIGVVSWGAGCGDAGHPGVYTRVGKYLTWIDTNTQDGIYCAGF